eukprot:334868_1
MVLDMLTDIVKWAILLSIFICAFIFAMDYVVAGDLNHDKRYQELEHDVSEYELVDSDYDLDTDTNDYEEYEPPLDNFGSIGLYILQALLGQQDWALIASDQEGYGPIFFNETRSQVVDALVILFSVLGAILLLNLLIALMASTFERVREHTFVRVNFNISQNT